MIIQAYKKLKELKFDDFGTILIGYLGIPEYGSLSNSLVNSYAENYFIKNENNDLDPNLSNILSELLFIDDFTQRNIVINMLREIVKILNIDTVESVQKWLLVCLNLKLENLSPDPLYGLLELSNFWLDWKQPLNNPHDIQGVDNRLSPEEYYTEANYNQMIAKNRDWLSMELKSREK